MTDRYWYPLYEELVELQEAWTRRLVEFCGLPWDEACLRFHETERAVRTASSEQVRRPIYRDSKDEWQLYTSHLDPLREALGEVLDCYPDAPARFRATKA